MDGLKCVIPMSCKPGQAVTSRQTAIFEMLSDENKLNLLYECDGCVTGSMDTHTGTYVNIVDWTDDIVVQFSSLRHEKA